MPLVVLHVVSEMGTGGAEAMVAELARAGKSRGWITHVASSGGYREDQLVIEGAIVAHRVPSLRRRLSRVVRAVLATRSAIRTAGPCVVIAHNIGATAVSWLAVASSRRRRLPILTVYHGVAEKDRRAAACLLDATSSLVVTVSDESSAELREAGLAKTRTKTISNAVTRPSMPSRAAARSALNLTDGEPVAICVARLVEQKRHDVLLEAWRRLAGEETLLLVGDGPCRASIEAQRKALGIERQVRVLGQRHDIATLLAASDVFVLSSDWEGLPVAMLEAMAAGVPVIATDVGGVSAVLAHGGGEVVPRRDPARLARSLSHALHDTDLRRSRAAQAVSTIECCYSANGMADSYDELIRRFVLGTDRKRDERDCAR